MTFRSSRLIAVLTLCALVLTAVSAVATPAAPDIEGHWAEAAIERLVDMGAVSGLPDGTFRPDLTVTRAEFVTMVNKSFGITPVPESTRFQDVKPGDWFGGQVEAAAAYGYVTGNPDGTFSPYRPITREQAAAMLVRVFGFSKLATEAEQDAVLAPFADADKVSAWAKADVATAISLGLLSGYTPTTLAPQPADLSAAGWQQWEAARTTEQREAVLKQRGSHGLITRAQTAAILVRALALEPAVEATVFDQAGTYGPEDGVETISGDVIVKADGVTLQNLIITGDLIITESVGDGTVVLENVTVKGDTEVKGGGTDSVIFRDCTLHGTVTVEKVDGQIRIVAEGSTSVPKVVLQSGAILISRDDGSFERIELPKDLAENTEVVLTGNFAEVEIAAENANVTIGAGSTVNSLVLTENATGTQVDLDQEASVTTVTADAEVEITGQGTIGTAEINVDGVTIEQKPDKVVLEPGVKANVGGKDVTEPKKSTGGGGGRRDETVSVSAISVTTEPDKTVYKLGEELDLTGLVVTATYTDGTTKIVEHSKLTVSGFDNETVGEQQITVTYEGKTATFVVNVVEDPEEPTEANFVSTGDVGIAPDTAGEAAGKIYAEYKLVANEEDISLAASNVEYIKVKVGEDGEWKDLTANTDATLWFNVEADQGVRYYEVKTKDGKVYTATLNWDKEINTTATWEATGKEGIRPGTEDTYVEYKLMDGENQVSLKVGEAKLFASKTEGKWKSHELNTDKTLWIKKDVSGTFTYFIVAEGNVMYKTTLEYTAPTEPEDPAEAKAAFIAAFNDIIDDIQVEGKTVANAAMTGEDITVTFKTSDAAEILAGAGVVFEALQELAEAESSITINDQKFNLDEELSISALANAILGDGGIEGFLEDKTITVTYTATVFNKNGTEFSLTGNLTFNLDVEEEPEDPAEAKAAFIAAFNDIIDDIQVEGKTVANAAMTGEDITVTFKTSDAAEILAGAGVVFEALQELAEAESSITINDQKFNLDEELSISALANAILGDGGIEGFLEDKTITVTYTATVFNKNGTEFSLTGNLTFNLDVEEEPEDPAEAKAAFIAAFNDIIDDIQVEGKTVANAAMTGEDITVTFKTSDAAEILAGAGVVFEALQELAEAESSITINDQKFNLDEELSISALANAILGDGGIEGFLEDKTITVTYTATVFNKNGTEFSLTGNLTFNLDVEEEPEDPAEAKAAFIAAFNDIIDDIQVEGKTVANAAMTGEDITVTFKTSDATKILAGAGVVFEALQELAEAESSITINDQKFNLDEELSISALAQAILGDGGIEGFLEDETITVTYTATVFNKNGTEFSLTGNLTFNLDVEEEPEDPAEAKAAFIAAFNDIIDDIQVEGKTVANAEMDEEENITVTFKTIDADEILAGAGVVFEALQELAEAESSITINDQKFNLDEELSISALAQAILGDGGIEGFLEDETITVTYTATVFNKNGTEFSLTGNLTFNLDVEEDPEDPAEAKAAFIAAFNDIIDDIQVEGKTVANAAMDEEENITVTFKTIDADEILAGAGVVFEALQELAEAESSITINGKTFNLDEELSISALAQAILGDGGIEGFLEDETITVTYTATVFNKNGTEFSLTGNLTFNLDVEEEPEDPAEAKAAFIAAFNDIIDDIQVEGKTVANAEMDEEENITVTFKTIDADEILAGAGVVFEALQELAEAESSITINGKTFNLDEELSISALAQAILGDGGIEGFLEDETITVTYTATVFNKNGTEFSLTGNLTFNLDVEEEPEDPAEAKAAFIAAFNDIIDDIQVEGKTVANAEMDEEENITVTFKTIDADEILAGAGVVFEALQELAEAESSITINDQKFNLDEELSISALAQAILGDGGIEGFLEDETITVTYTATVFNKNGTEFSLTGNLTFNLDVEEDPEDPAEAKAAFIAAFNDIIDDIQVEGKTVANAAMDEEENITVTFKTIDADEILAGAGVVFEALQELAEAESSITINGKTFNLDEELSISALAQAILGDGGIEGFLEDETITVTYTATVFNKNGTEFSLTGNLTFNLDVEEEPEDPAEAKAAFIAAFNDIIDDIQVEGKTVANAEMDEEENITVTFKTIDADEILAGAGVVFEALQELAEAESSITINGKTFNLDEELSISALAQAILGDGGIEGFLEDETITVTYTATVFNKNGTEFSLTGNLTFNLDVEEEPEDPAEAKAAFIAAFNDIIDDIQVEGKTVANAEMDEEENITVTFKTIDADEILAGAGVVFEALQELAEAESSITINGKTFNLDEELSISALAQAILGDGGIEGFLEDETITVTYTATVFNKNGTEFSLTGNLTFNLDVEEDPEDPAEAKAAFIAAFNDIIDDIQVEGKTVANAEMDEEENITVTFKTIDADEILAGAGVVFEALQELAEAESSITINGKTFNLDEELSISALAQAILGDGGIEGFLEDETITVTYTATVFNKNGTEFSLTGNLTFNLDVEEDPEDPAEAKAAFIAAFNDIIDDIQVEGKTVANAAMTGEDITVTFKTSDAAEILAGAGVVFEALQELAEAESSITINDQKFNLDEELSISALANAILGDGGIEGFLEDETITVTYTATVFNKNGTEFSLTGNLTFNLDVEEEPEDPAEAKAAFIAAFNDIIDDIQVEGKTVANAEMDEEENITVTFKTIDADEILAGAGVVFEALQELAEAESSITINGKTFNLDEELSISALAQAILGDGGIEGFLEDETITVTYTATVFNKNGTEFSLTGNLTFNLDVEDAQK